MALDARCKDKNWRIDVKPEGGVSNSDAALAVLMDIRDRLDTLPELLAEVKKANEILRQPWLSSYLNALNDTLKGKP